MTSSMTSQGNVSSINADIIIVFLGYTCQKRISMNNTFRDCRSKVNITGLLCDLGTNKQHCKLYKYNYFWDCDGIDKVTLQLWKFSDFCSRHTVGVAGDDIMSHFLVTFVMGSLINLYIFTFVMGSLINLYIFTFVMGALINLYIFTFVMGALINLYIFTFVMSCIYLSLVHS